MVVVMEEVVMMMWNVDFCVEDCSIGYGIELMSVMNDESKIGSGSEVD